MKNFLKLNLANWLNYFRLEKEKQLVKSEVDEAKLQTEHVNKAKVNKKV